MALLPITAVSCVSKDIILIAQGSRLLLSNNNNNNISSVSVLSNGSIIHGIEWCQEIGEKKYIIFGQKEFQIVKINSEIFPIYTKPIFLKDWIISCHSFSEFLFILTIHNQCLKIRISDGNIIKHISPPNKSIVYSATLHGHNFDTFKIASGTVTNQIIVWKPYNMELEPIKLIGHKGVIFSVEFNRTGTNLVSVSDDRTVRVWQLETATLQATLYGHTSRIWGAIFAPCDTFILSIGEDSTLRLWDTKRCECVHTFSGHKGKSVWSVTTSPDGKYAYTGGNDCSVRKWNLTPFIQNSENTNSKSIEITNEIPRLVHTVDSCVSVVLTANGSLWKILIKTGEISFVYKSDLFSSYSVMSLTPRSDTIAIGGLKGHLLLLNISNCDVLFLEKICVGKILNLNWFESNFLLISSLDGLCIFTQFSNENKLTKICSLILPKSSHRWVVSSLILKENLILGDGKGSLHLYSNFRTNVSIFSLFKVHGPNPVTSLQQKGEFVCSTGRDGKLKIIQIKNGKLILKNSIQVLRNIYWLEGIYMNPEGPTLALAFHGNEILLVDVRDETVLVNIPCGGGHRSWDTNSFENILRTQKFFLSYIKCHETILVSREIGDILDHPLSVPFLGREGLCLAILDTFVDGTVVLVAGDEIGNISVLSFKSETGFRVLSTNQCHIGNINVIELCDLNNSLFMFTAGGRGLLKVWEVNKYCLQNPNSIFEFYFFVCEVSAKPIYKRKSKKLIGQSEIDDFRITNLTLFSQKFKPSNCVVFCCCSDGFIRVYLFTPDTLLTPLSCVEHTNRCLLSSCLLYAHNLTPILFTAATDGEIVFWDFSKLIQYLETSEFSENFVPNLLSKLSVLKCHLSGVNSISISLNSVLKIATLVSVGDDASISVTKLGLNSENFSIISQKTNLNEHNSSIMKIEILEFEKQIFLLTVSRDQRLKLFVLNDMELTLELKKAYLLDVTNISDMKCQLRENKLRIFVVGEGLQTINLIL